MMLCYKHLLHCSIYYVVFIFVIIVKAKLVSISYFTAFSRHNIYLIKLDIIILFNDKITCIYAQQYLRQRHQKIIHKSYKIYIFF